MRQETILGIDPGTNVMGYSVIEICDKQTTVLDMGVLNLTKLDNQAVKLAKIFELTTTLIETYKASVLAIEEPFFGKNPQSMLKLGRAQGVVIGACLHKNLEVFEYTPRKIKQAITGKGAASKEQVAAMLKYLVTFKYEEKYLDATDALAVAMCHVLQNNSLAAAGKYNSWESFLSQNKHRIR